MKNDKLKERIAQERSVFEQEEPSAGIWDKIAADLAPEQAEQKSRFPWAVAASVAVVVGMLGLSYYLGVNADKPLVAEDPALSTTVELADISSELAEIDQYYSVQVGHKLQLLSTYEVDADLMEELEFLNEEFEVLKQEMGQGIDDGKVVEALIQNYRLRLSLLEDLLEAVDSKSTETKISNNEYDV